MSFLIALGGASFALALQASASGAIIQTDSDASLQACIDQAPANPEVAPSEEWKPFMSCILQDIAMQMNEQLPLKLENDTTLVAVSSSGAQFNYTYVVNADRSDLDQATVEALESTKRQEACADQNMMSTMELGGSYFYRWIDRSGDVIRSFRISSC